jgi:3-deoxy-D-manno-octulosonic acid kinase
VSVPALPPGYVRSAQGSVELVARDWASAALARAVTAHGSLFRWAEAQAPREPLRGRGVAWATTLEAGAEGQASTRVVVRHSRHGGLLAAFTGDLFPKPTRAPRELATAARLAAGGVATPEIIAYTVHPVAGVLARSDVMTRRLPDGRDFPEAWRADPSPAARQALVEATAVLLRSLSGIGAQHPDLNLKNVFIAGDGPAVIAYVLDVDRVTFGESSQVAARNFARFARSARKWNEERQLDVGDDALVRLAALAWVDQ